MTGFLEAVNLPLKEGFKGKYAKKPSEWEGIGCEILNTENISCIL